ncbi:quinone oxidoreductase [Paenibacillus sp. HWE-109]|uniref:quinone oxidoreductase family protein n=1 Tax=Paenibacillus sp. HWE-109 TaxID=1306526 RepID=UPI001EDFC47B|nr:quinone oxidoreductase [Paenibacillus sp. HWE-109]UKS30839.1 quinone oxidoreductase [Paenibacillus sp. HWE-109]
MKALIFEHFGGPEVLQYKEIPDPSLVSGHILVRTKAVGMNFADIYRRRGNYHLAGNPPFILGYEGAGVVEQAAPDVTQVKVGDRIAFVDVPYANAKLVAVPVDRAIPLPADISFEQAAAILLQGMTAHYLVNDSYRLQAGEQILVHAAAGGVGQILIQLAKSKGAKVIGLTSSELKKAVAMNAGADEVYLYDSNWVKQVTAYTEGQQGVDVVYDSVGSTLMDSFAAAKTKGTIVFYGMAGGDPPRIDPRMLMDTSKTLTGGDLWNHITSLSDRIERSQQLFEALRQAVIRIDDLTTFPLSEGADAHRLLESRKSTGKILLIP